MWYYSRDKQKLGPVSFDELRELARAGQIGPSDMVLEVGQAKWTPAGSVAGLFTPASSAETAIPDAASRASEAPASAGPEPSAHHAVTRSYISADAAPAPGLQTDAEVRMTIPGYEVLGVLGRGGMGIVYRARQVKLSRLVALKMIRSGAYAGSAELERFRTEALAAARLQHPNIVQIHEVGEHGNLPFFSLEYIEGGTLGQRLAGTPLPAREAAELAETLARAMHYAHQRGVVHRDLKPANVLLTPAGQPKIADFGLAKRLDLDEGQTHTGQVMGTPSYMAPEQATGNVKDTGPATDVYALGAILYEMLTGRPPFKGASTLETLEQVRSQEPLPPSRLLPKVPRDLDVICLKCLEKDAAKRYASAAELADDLRCFLAGEPIRARAIGNLRRAAKWARRRPALASLFAVITVALLSLLGVWAGFTAELQEERTRAQNGELKALEESNTAKQERHRAEERERTTRRYHYANTMTMVADAWEKGDVASMTRLLEGLQPLPGQDDIRGFEWHYFWRLCHLERQTVTGHGGPIHAVAYSADGVLFATAGGDGRDRTLPGWVKLWDAAAAKEVGTLRGHKGSVDCLAFAPGGKLLATAGEDRVIKLWDIETKKELATLEGHKEAIRYVEFSRDTKLLLSVSDDKCVRLWTVGANPGKIEHGPTLPHAGKVWRAAFTADGKNVLSLSTDLKTWDTSTGREVASKDVGSAYACAFSRDGKLLVTLGSRSAVWKTQDFSLQTLIPGQQPAGVLAFSPDGKLIATGSGSSPLSPGFMKLFDAASGEQLATAKGHMGGIPSLVFSPDGKTLLTGSLDGTAKLWDVAKLVSATAVKAFRKEEHSAVQALAFSPDGKTLATGSEDALVKLWNLAAPAKPKTLRGHTGGLTAIAFSPDGKTLVSAATDRKVHLWDLSTGHYKCLPRMATDEVTCVAFTPDGQCLALGLNKLVELWDWKKGSKVAAFPVSHQRDMPARMLAFSPDSALLAAAFEGSWARVWNLKASKEVHTTPVEIHGVAFAPDGKLITTAYAKAFVWERDTLTPIRALEFEGVHLKKPVHCISPDGTFVVALGGYGAAGTLRGWQISGPKAIVLNNIRPRDPIRAAAVSPDGKTLASAGEDGAVRLWDTTSWTVRTFLPGHAREVLASTLAPDGKTLALAMADGSIPLLDPSTGDEFARLEGHGDAVTSLTFTSDGARLASASYDQTVKLWDMTRRTEVRTLKGFRWPVRCVAFSPDGRLLAAGDGRVDVPGEVRVWDVASGDERAVFKGFRWAVRGLAFAPDGKTLATVTGDEWVAVPGDLKLWDVATGKPRLEVQGHFGPILCVAYSPDGRFLATGSVDRTIKLWEAATGREHAVLKHDAAVQALAFAPNGKELVAGLGYHPQAKFGPGRLALWDVSILRPRGAFRAHDSDVNSLAFAGDGAALYSASKNGGLSRWPLALTTPNVPVASPSPKSGGDANNDADWQVLVSKLHLAEIMARSDPVVAVERLCALLIKELHNQGALAPGNGSHRRSLALVYGALAQARLREGRLEEAETALALQAALINSDSDVTYRQRQAELYFQLSSQLGQKNRLADARTIYVKALSLWAALEKETPGSVDFRGKLGTLVFAEGDWKTGGAGSLEIWQKLVADFPDILPFRDTLAKMHQSLGVRLMSKQANAARKHLEQAAALAEQLVKEAPESSEHQEFRILALQNLAQAFHAGGQPAEAVRLYRNLIKQATANLTVSPNDDKSLRNVHRAYSYLYTFLKGSERDAVFAEARDVYEQLASAARNNPEAQSNLVQFYEQWAGHLHRHKRFNEAEKAAQRSIELGEKLVADYPDKEWHHIILASAYTNWALRLGDDRLEDQEKVLRRALEINVQLSNKSPRLRPSLAACYEHLAPVLHKLGRLQEAEEVYRTSASLSGQIAAEQKNDAVYQQIWTQRLTSLAKFLNDVGKHQEALEPQRLAVSLCEKRAADMPKDYWARRALADAYWLLADTLLRTGDHAEAVSLAAKLPTVLDSATDYYRAAALSARALAVVEKDARRTKDQRRLKAALYAESALKYLSEADRRGFNNIEELTNDGHFRALQDHVDFVRLARRIEIRAMLQRAQELAAKDQLAEAEKSYRAILGLLDKYGAGGSGDPGLLAEHARTLGKTANLLRRQDKGLAEGDKLLMQALTLWEKLAQVSPSPFPHRFEYWAVLSELGLRRYLDGTPEAARLFFEKMFLLQQSGKLGPSYRYATWLNSHLGQVLHTALREGDHERVFLVARQRPQLFPENSVGYRESARFIARCLPLVEQDKRLGPDDKRKLKERYTKEVVALLDNALAKGLPDFLPLHLDPDLALLKEEDDLRKFLERRPVDFAKVMLFEGELTKSDPLDTVRLKSPCKIYPVELQAGQTYVIHLLSASFDPFVRIENADGKHLAGDDNGGGFPDARLVFQPKTTGKYRLVATASFSGTGPFRLALEDKGIVAVATPKPLPQPGFLRPGQRLGALYVGAAVVHHGGAGPAPLLASLSPLYADGTYLNARASALLEHGQTLANQKAYADAGKAYREAVTLLETLVQRSPDDSRLLAELAHAHMRTGTFFRFYANQAAVSEPFYRKAAELWDKLVTTPSPTPSHQSDYAYVLAELGLLASRQGTLAEARALLEKAVVLQTASFKANPTNSSYRSQLQHRLVRLADIVLQQGDHARAAEVAGELARLFPDNATEHHQAVLLVARCAEVTQRDRKLTADLQKKLLQQYGDQAVGLMRQAVAKGFNDFLSLRIDPRLESLRRLPAFGKFLLEVPIDLAKTKIIQGTLSTQDPADSVRKASKQKVYPMEFEAGKSYTIHLLSQVFDPYLRIEDDAGKNLAEDDDSGGNLNARLVFAPARKGRYRIVVTSFRPASGPFTLAVEEHAK